jgi:hypothetical protein
MAKLTAAERAALPLSAFAIPEKRAYPIHNEGHARAALAMVAKFGTSSQVNRVRKAVYKRFPHIEKDSFDHIKPVND